MSNMTLQRVQILQARAYDLAARLRAMGVDDAALAVLSTELSGFPSPRGGAVTSAGQKHSAASRAYRLADSTELVRPDTVCSACYVTLEPRYIHPDHTVRAFALPRDCGLCRIAATSPEEFTGPFCSFMTANPTVFHAVDYFRTKAAAEGYEELLVRDDWSAKLRPGGKYFVTRNGSSIIAFAVGKAYKPGRGVAMIAGHVDAVTARLKPVSAKPTRHGFVQLGVAPYGGGLNETWWDRDLGIGGRVVVRDPESGKTQTRLVKIGWPVARIPTLAPHFGVGIMGSNNKETQAVPIIGLGGGDGDGDAAPPLAAEGSFANTQPPRLVKIVASELGVQDYSAILNWDLELFDTQPAQTGGLDREFIFAGRIDDKLCSWGAFQALLAAENEPDNSSIKLVALFDDEEIGSLLRQGARANFLPATVERAVEALCAHEAGVASAPSSYGPGILGRTYAQSFLLSADVIHAVNPNFDQLYLPGHMPRLNVGIALSADSNGHMASDAASSAVLRRVGELGGGAVQVFQIRNDSRSGGTVGPMLSSAMGVRAADAGMPQLSMHSIRATTGALDPGLGVRFFKTFLEKWEQIDEEWH